MTITPRWYQEEAINSIYHYFMSHSGNPLIGLPGGTGKSIIPAIFIHRVMQHWPSQKFLLITHVKELIEQNADKLKIIWPNVPLGIHSAGLGERNTVLPVIYGGIQSMIKNPRAFGHRDIIFIDEAHLVNQDEASMYQTFIAIMKSINPNIKIIGMSATLFRMGQGYITDGGLFTDIIYDMTNLEGFNRLLEEGYLCKLVPFSTKTQLDISNVQVIKGEYNSKQLQETVDKNEITFKALKEDIEIGFNRKCWLIFASGIEHAEHIAQMLNTQFGIDCAAVHSKQPAEYNDRAIKAFKNGSLRSIVNFGKLTTGFDNPPIDLIIDLRPTMSVPLHIQKYCRGARPVEGKTDCLVLDHAGNTARLGCINDPVIPRKKGDQPGEAPVKICDACGAYNYAKAKFCCNCGKEFIFKTKIVAKPGKEEIIKTDAPIIETFNVDYVVYAKRQKTDKETKQPLSPPYIQTTYFTGVKQFKENVFPEHGKYATKLFVDWWRQRHATEPPKTTDEALQMISKLRKPKKIRVNLSDKYPSVVGAEW